MRGWSAEKKGKVFDQLLAEFFLDAQQPKPNFGVGDRRLYKRRMDALNVFTYWQLRCDVDKYFVDTYARKRVKHKPGVDDLRLSGWIDAKQRTGFLRCLPVVIPAWLRGYWSWADVVDKFKLSRKDLFGLFSKGSFLVDDKVKVPFRKKLKSFLLKQIDKL